MKTKLIIHAAVIAGLICGVLAQGAVAITDPTEQLRPFVGRILTILSDPATADSASTRVDKIMDVAREGFDFAEMSKRVLGRHWNDLSTGEKSQFTDLFTELLKYAYVSQMEQYSSQKVVFGKQRIRGERAMVETLVTDGERNIPVSYIMLFRDQRWLVYDVVVEGVSLIRNYLEQFQEILRKDDFQVLTRQLQEKIEAFRQQQTGTSAFLSQPDWERKAAHDVVYSRATEASGVNPKKRKYV